MFKKILVPINPLKKDQDLLVKTAFNLGIEHNSMVTFLYLGNNKDAMDKLKEYINICRENGLNTIYKVENFPGDESEIPETIAEIAEDSDLIIMGHLKFDKIYRFVHHSTASDLINLVSIPVMVIPDEGTCEFILQKKH